MQHHADAHEDAPELRLDVEDPSWAVALWFRRLYRFHFECVYDVDVVCLNRARH